MTFGALGAYAEVMRYRYIYGRTVLSGRRLRFTGSWTDLFLLNFKWGFFCVITLGIYFIWRMTRKQQWVTEHVVVDDAPEAAGSRFTATVGGNFGNAFGWTLLTLVSFGLCYFMAHAHRNRYITTHSVLSSGSLRYTVTGPKYFVKRLVWTLLTMLTFGIYAIWVTLRASQFEVKNTHFVDPAAVPYRTRTAAVVMETAAASASAVYAAPRAAAEKQAESEAPAKKKLDAREKWLRIAVIGAGACALALMTLVPLIGGAVSAAWAQLERAIIHSGDPYGTFAMEKYAYQFYQAAYGLQIFMVIAAVPTAILVFLRKLEKNWIANGVFTALSLVGIIVWIVGFAGAVNGYRTALGEHASISLRMPLFQTAVMIAMLVCLLLQIVLFAARFVPQIKAFIDGKKNGTPVADMPTSGTEIHAAPQKADPQDTDGNSVDRDGLL